MSDNIALAIDGEVFDTFSNYSIESDLYNAADAFSVEMVKPQVKIQTGSRCQLYVNGQMEMTGIIERRIPSYNKEGKKLKLEGRDLMGLVVDHCCEKFFTVKGKKLTELADLLLKDIPFINRKLIRYEEDVRGRLKGKKHAKSFDSAQTFGQIAPGQSAFQVLSEYAMSRGLLFFSLDDGSFVFGKPVAKGEPAFSLITRLDGQGNNIKEGTLFEDISKQYSKITVIGQSQGTDALGASQLNSKATALNKDFPYYKPFVTTNSNDTHSPKEHARMILEKQRFEGFQLIYKVAGHSQAGRNWRINELCRVYDEELEIDGVYLIYNRVFELSKEEGAITWLKLGLPGVVSA